MGGALSYCVKKLLLTFRKIKKCPARRLTGLCFMFSKHKYHCILRSDFFKVCVLVTARSRHFFILFFFTLNPAVISLPEPSFFFCEYLTARNKPDRQLPVSQNFADRLHIVVTAEDRPSAQQFRRLHIRAGPEHLLFRFQRKQIRIFQKNRALTCQGKCDLLCLRRQLFFSLHSCERILKQSESVLHHQHIPRASIYQRNGDMTFFDQFFQMKHVCRTHHININSCMYCRICSLCLA